MLLTCPWKDTTLSCSFLIKVEDLKNKLIMYNTQTNYLLLFVLLCNRKKKFYKYNGTRTLINRTLHISKYVRRDNVKPQIPSFTI